MKSQTRYPRSILPLVIVLAVVLLGFFYLKNRDDKPDFTQGGKLFPLSAEEVLVLRLTKLDVDYKFERIGDRGWSLSGGVHDFVDTKAMANLVDFLVSAQSGRILPGTAVEDRRYDFDGPESVRLAVFATKGREFHLVLGAENPVTGGVYGSGLGRSGCFPVGQGLRNRLKAMPVSVQEKLLLPSFDPLALSEVDVWRGDEKLTLRSEQSRWWLKEPDDGLAQLGISFRNYNAMYNDRRRVVDGTPWLLADPSAVEQLIYEGSRILVRDIIPPENASGPMEEWAMDPPWRKIAFHGTGINNDPSAGSPDQLFLSYGPPLENDYLPVLRRDNLMLVDKMGSDALSKHLGQWLDTGALPFRVEVGDSLHFDKEGARVLVAYPGQDKDISRWVGRFSNLGKAPLKGHDYKNAIENLILNMDRLEIVQVLPPSEKAWILEDRERLQLSFWTSKEGAAGRRDIEFGWLDLDHLPGGDVSKALALAEEKDGEKPAGMWVPQSGKLIQIPAHILSTFRNLD